MPFRYNPDTDEYEPIQVCVVCGRDLPNSGSDVCNDCEDFIDAMEEVN